MCDMMMHHGETRGEATSGAVRETARELADLMCRGFVAHDRGKREEAIEAFTTVDAWQFQHLSADKARLAATAYVDALWEKDTVELRSLQQGSLNTDSLKASDWSPVAERFRARAAVVGMDPAYAEQSTIAWKRHKTGGDYWTPMQRAQVHEIRAAIGNDTYPDKPKHGQSGFGPEAARYALAIELHDMHTSEHWIQAKRVMVPYYECILRKQTHEQN